MSADQSPKKICLLVLGMHRSGTSAIARMLSLLGANLPERLIGADGWNQKGYWESLEFNDIHNAILASAGSHWSDWSKFNRQWYDSGEGERYRRQIIAVLQDDFAESTLFVVKDPRVCRLLPLWKSVLEEFGAEPRAILPIRNPIDVAASLRARDGMLPTQSNLLWTRHAIDAEFETQGLKRAVVRYEDFIDDWRSVSQTIASRLGISWPRYSPISETEIDRFIEASLKHHASSTDKVAARADAFGWARDVYRAYGVLADRGEDAAALKRLDRVRNAFDKASAAIAPAVAELNAIIDERTTAAGEADELREASEARASELRSELAARDRQVGELEGALSTRVRELEAAFEGEQSVSDKLRKQLASRDSLIGRLEGECSEFRTQLASRDSLIGRLEGECSEFRTQLASRDSLIGRLEGECSDFRTQVEHLDADIRERKVRLKRIRRSVSWRLTAPICRLAGTGNWFLRRLFMGPALRFRGLRWLARLLPDETDRRTVSNVWLLRASALFEEQWYLEQNPKVRKHREDPVLHYLRSGARKGRNPSPRFDGNWYLARYPDVAKAGLNPLVHYLEFGTEEGRDLRPSFDTGKSPTQHPDSVEQKSKSIEPPRTLYQRAYSSYVEAAKREPSSEDYVPDSDLEPEEAPLPVRIIAFYLPQFHPIPENDEWWGKGFTEWTNVSKAVPQFEGHCQPRLPGTLGFYDLRLKEVQRQQIEMAKLYGIYGFCYHYYWFSGHKLLERPLQQVLTDPTLDLPFCICWANENWTRRWDGQENEVLLNQTHSPETDFEFIDDAIPALRDPRYITIDGRPLLIVYRVNLLPEPKETAKRWRTRCRDRNVPEPYLIAAQTFGITDPRPFGFDAAVQFPPHNMPAQDITDHVSLLNPQYKGRVYSYRSVVDGQITASPKDPYPVFGCAYPGWDNEARKPGQGHVYAGSSPRLYAEWLGKLCGEAAERQKTDERIVFVNAWNEWAEGAYLEPDRRYGFAYLRATTKTLWRVADAKRSPHPRYVEWLAEKPENRNARTAVIAHAFNPELWEELAAYLANVTEEVDLFATVARREDASSIRAHLPANVNQLFVGVVPNRGRDIAPFLACLSSVVRLGYELGLKIHTKGTSTRDDGNVWRTNMLNKLLGSEAATSRILDLMCSDQSIGLVAPTGHLLPIDAFWGRSGERELNLMHFKRLAAEVGLPRQTHGFSFAAGSVYWFRPRALGLLASLSLDEIAFPPERGQRDGTVAHAIERLVGLASSTDGWRIEVTGAANVSEDSTEWLTDGCDATYPFACATAEGIAMQGPVAGLR